MDELGEQHEDAHHLGPAVFIEGEGGREGGREGGVGG